MNERIRELAREAGGHNNISKFRGHFLPPEPGYIDPATVDLVKFAELIMEEMYDFIMDESANDRGIPDLGKVKEHFGVEE